MDKQKRELFADLDATGDPDDFFYDYLEYRMGKGLIRFRVEGVEYKATKVGYKAEGRNKRIVTVLEGVPA